MSPLAMRTACSYTGLAGMALKTSGFLGPMDLSDHFRKHGEDFSAATAQHYEFLANAFLSGSPGPRHHQCLRKHGDLLRFDCVTNEFGVLSSKGTIRTYYILKLGAHKHPSNISYFVDGCAQ